MLHICDFQVFFKKNCNKNNTIFHSRVLFRLVVKTVIQLFKLKLPLFHSQVTKEFLFRLHSILQGEVNPVH